MQLHTFFHGHCEAECISRSNLKENLISDPYFLKELNAQFYSFREARIFRKARIRVLTELAQRDKSDVWVMSKNVIPHLFEGPQFYSQIRDLGKIGTRPMRFERTTCGAGVHRSIQLNYGRTRGTPPCIQRTFETASKLFRMPLIPRSAITNFAHGNHKRVWGLFSFKYISMLAQVLGTGHSEILLFSCLLFPEPYPSFILYRTIGFRQS